MAHQMKVSIVIPVYNAERFLKPCLDSLCGQTEGDFELICVDDGSTDASLSILQEYERKDDRIKVLENTVEGPGGAEARNTGMAVAKGEYLLILDADDYFEDTLVEKSYQTAVETKADIVLFDARFFDTVTGDTFTKNRVLRPEFLPEQRFFHPTEIKNDLFQCIMGPAWNQLYRHDYIKELGIKFQAIHVIDDGFFTFSALASAQKIAVLPEKLLHYRLNNSLSQVANLDRDPLTPVKLGLALQKQLQDKGLFATYEESYLKKMADTVHWYQSCLKDTKKIEILHARLHENGLEELGFFSETGQKCLSFYFVDEFALQQKYTFPDYVYHKYQRTQLNILNIFHFSFPRDAVNSSERVILYGAGVIGRTFFAQNTMGRFCQIVSWVDKNYQAIGFPVAGLEEFSSVVYDKVLIAVEKESVAAVITEELVERGIERRKIVWKDPKRREQ